MPAIPNIAGLSLAGAVSALTADGFNVGTVTIEDSGSVPVDTVDSQNPVAGTIEALGASVNIVVSTGPASIINKVTQKLFSYLHRIFDKNPYSVLAFRVQLAEGGDLVWSISNGVLTLSPVSSTVNLTDEQGGSLLTESGDKITLISSASGHLTDEDGGSLLTESGEPINLESSGVAAYSFNIANFKIGQLAVFIANLPGYTVPYQDTSAYSLLSALALLDASGDTFVSNGDHVYGYTNPLWAFFESAGSEIGLEKAEIPNALAQMSTKTALDEWLDYHGSFYNVPRQQGELDPGYSPRMIAEVLQPRGNNIAIAEAIKSVTQAGEPVFVIDAINDTGFAITYNGLIHFDGSEFYDAGLGAEGAYGFFDVDFSFDFSGPVSQATYFNQILTTVESFRDAGTQLRAVIFRNNGSNTIIVSDSFINGIRVIVYNDFTGADFRLLENGLVRFTETGDARILES